jgi:phosphate transport system substrate-binding protein
MWQQQKKDSAIVNLALSLALATTPMAANVFMSTPSLAQSATETPTFPLPQTVENGSTVRVDGSSSLALINQNLKQGFEQQFAGTKVEVANNGTDAALKAVLEGKVDIAAIGRGLTPEEKAQGLEQVRLHREKIAIIVGEENPFNGSLTDKQFARIFRGKSVTDWSQVGGPPGKIRVIDRPDTSDTRQALNNYPVFKVVRFTTGPTATQLTEDNTAEIVKQLGKDGISYARVNQISKLPGVRVLQLHQALPDDPKYPFSQPLVYVYKSNPSPAVAGFLGFALATPGQQAIEQARTAEAEAIAKGETPTLQLVVNPASTTETTTAQGTPPAATTAPDATTAPTTAATTAPAATSNQQQPAAAPPTSNPLSQGQIPLWWLVLPLGVIAGLLLWIVRTSSSSDSAAAENQAPASPEPSAPTAIADNAVISEPAIPPANGTNGNTPHNGAANLLEGTTPATTAATGLAVGAGALISSMVIGKETDNHKAEDNGYDLSISPWDMEAPAAVVNTTYPPMVDVSKTTTNAASPTTATTPETTTPVAEVTTTTQFTPVEANSSLDFPEIPEDSVNEDDWGFELVEDVTQADSQAESTFEPLDPEIEKLNDVADAAEPELEDTEELLDDIAVLVAAVSASSGADVVNQLELNGEVPTSVTDDILAIADPQSKIVLTPSSYNSADVVWEISETGQQMLQNAGKSQLSLRVYDVTNIDLSYQQPQLLQQYDYELGISNGTVAIPQTERDYIAAIGYATAGDGWVTIARSEIVRVFGSQHTNNTAANVILVDETSHVLLTPNTHKFADVSWEISDTSKQMLKNAGIFQLGLRLYDVTNLDLSYQQPQLVQQYELDLETANSTVSIPETDRDYVAEIGYPIVGDRWVSIARSEIVRVFSPPFVEDEDIAVETASLHLPADDSTITLTPRTPKWAYASWSLSENRKEILHNAGVTQLALRLYDATDMDLSYQQPQLVQQYECEEITHDRYVAIPTSDRDYMIELGYVTEGDGWATIIRSTAVRVFSRPQQDFWFVADAELIIHGATEPNATVNIAGNPISLKPDGTFHLRVPFSENLIDYLITAVAADGENSKTIHKKFSQEVAEAEQLN